MNTASKNSFWKSFGFAWTGIKIATRGRNFRVQLACAIVAIALCFVLNVLWSEFLIVILASTVVLAMETANSALEHVCDKFHPEVHPQIAAIKDLAAGAVLLVSIGALIVGLLIFVPYFL